MASSSRSCNEITVKATIADGDVTDFEFTPRVRKDITAEELSALFDEAKARVWGFLQPVFQPTHPTKDATSSAKL